MNGNMFFAKRIKELRELKGDSQEDLANLFGYKKQAVSHWENNGKVPRGKVLEKLAERYQTSSDYLLGITDNPERVSTEPQKPKDLEKFLDQQEIMFDGVPLTEDDKAKIRKSLEIIFWDAKEKNKKARADAKARKEKENSDQ